jgi:hypothetical protein
MKNHISKPQGADLSSDIGSLSRNVADFEMWRYKSKHPGY